MSRFMNLAIHVTPDEYSLSLCNAEESSRIHMYGRWFSAKKGVAAFYDFVRCDKSNRITGFEFHLTNHFDAVLAGLKGFRQQPALATVGCRWRFELRNEPSTNQWDQILSANPFIADDETVLLIVQVWHLDNDDYVDIESIASARTVS